MFWYGKFCTEHTLYFWAVAVGERSAQLQPTAEESVVCVCVRERERETESVS